MATILHGSCGSSSSPPFLLLSPLLQVAVLVDLGEIPQAAADL
jgi:hypothetical protein